MSVLRFAKTHCEPDESASKPHLCTNSMGDAGVDESADNRWLPLYEIHKKSERLSMPSRAAEIAAYSSSASSPAQTRSQFYDHDQGYPPS